MSSSGETEAKLEKKEAPINVAVFIDYENVYRALLQERTNVLRLAFFEKLRRWCAEHGRRVVRVVVYCNFDIPDLHDSHHQSTLQGYGVETVHTSNQGKNYADLKLTIDVLSSMYSNDNIDEFFIMSNDKDMTPLLNTIRANKRNVTLITAGTQYNPVLSQFADRHVQIDEICQEPVDDREKVIERIAENFWTKFRQYLEGLVVQYPETQIYKHQELRYALKKQSQYHKVMKYELAAILKDLYAKDEVFFYEYTYKEKPCIGIGLTDKRHDMLDMGIIRSDDVVQGYDLDEVIEELYCEACK